MSGVQLATTLDLKGGIVKRSFCVVYLRLYREVLQLARQGRIKLRFMPSLCELVENLTECNDNQSFRALASYFYLNTTNSKSIDCMHVLQIYVCTDLEDASLLQLKELSLAQKQHGTPDFGQSGTSSRAHHSSKPFNIPSGPQLLHCNASSNLIRFSSPNCTEPLD